MHFHSRTWFAVMLLVAAAASRGYAVDATWNHAVELSATIPASPPWSITLTWPEDTAASPEYAPAYTVFRKTPEGNSWGTAVPLPARQTSYVDGDVVEGVRYEYRVVREFRRPGLPEFDHDGYGYIQAGINIPFVAERGKVILVVENTVAEQLGGKVAQLRDDLVGDGWQVAQINVGADWAPARVRQMIRDEYDATKPRADVVFLLGHVPIARSGNYAPDGHEPRALPTDAFYGDVDGNWVDANGDGIYDQDQIASDIELQVGRVDFAAMDLAGSGKTELQLVERYLDKDHAYRHAVVRPPRRALIADRIGEDRGRAPAASGYRAFATFFGPENVFRADTEDTARDEDRWIAKLTAGAYAWTFGSGGGAVDSIAFLGPHGEYKSASSSDLAAGAKCTFYLLFGSYFVDWAQPNNLMRAALFPAQWDPKLGIHVT